jgi:hypothetical protein
MSMLRMIIAAASVLFAIVVFLPAAWAGNATEGIVLYTPIEGVTVVTVSTDVEEEGGAEGEVPAVNIVNQVNVVNVLARRFSSRCGIGVPYPWLRRYCGDPLYPF